MTSEEIRSTEFERVRKGYNPEDVDDFLLLVASEVENIGAETEAVRAERDRLAVELEQVQARLAAEREQADSQISEAVAAGVGEALAAKEDAEAKMYILAEKVEEYRGQEDNLKNALINAQRMGETVVYEARQKAEQMLREATGQAELLTQKATREIVRERAALERMLGEVSQFKSTVLNLYKQHIESLSALDPPAARAQAALDETARYRDIGAGPPPEPASDSKAEFGAPPLGSAEPQLPVVDAAPVFAPLEVAIESKNGTWPAGKAEMAEPLADMGPESDESGPI
jgi:cell division initiation protein